LASPDHCGPPTPCQSVKLTPVFIRNGTTTTARKARAPGRRKRA
jgi:hypothetical protein